MRSAIGTLRLCKNAAAVDARLNRRTQASQQFARGLGGGLVRRYAACGFSRGRRVLDGDGGSAVVEDRRIFAIDRDIAERVKSLPRNPGRIGDPVLVRPGVAAGLLVLLH